MSTPRRVYIEEVPAKHAIFVRYATRDKHQHYMAAQFDTRGGKTRAQVEQWVGEQKGLTLVTHG